LKEIWNKVGVSMKYEFHRDFYNLVLGSINNHSTTFLLGTKRCGKTVCLQQIREELPNSEYIDFKDYAQNERIKILDRIIADIKSDKDAVYLLDGMTSVANYDIEICKIAEAYTDLKNINTKIVFCGSQSYALGVCADRAFAGNTCIISADFLTYSEFLKFKGIQEASEGSYNRYIMEISNFYNDFISLKQYFRDCINETIISNVNAADMVIGNETSLTEEDADFLIAVCHMALFNLQNSVSAEIAQKISNVFTESYNIIKSADVEKLRDALYFLRKCGLITICPIANDIENVPNVERRIRTEDGILGLKDELFSSFTIGVSHPLIYMQMLKEILGEDMTEKLSDDLLESVVEGHLRGLKPAGFELKVSGQDENGMETQKKIDLVDLKTSIAIEFGISQRRANSFDIISDYFNKIILTKDSRAEKDGVAEIPYYEYLYELAMK
jgi:hypothetical protein